MPPFLSPEIAEQIRLKKSQYCRLADTNNWEKMDTLLAADARFEFYDTEGSLVCENGVDFKFNSRAEFVAYFSEAFKVLQTIHVVGPGELEQVGPNEVKAVWTVIYHAGPRGMDGGMHGTGGGHYYETWTREQGGQEWLMKDMRMERIYWKVLGA
ncbi:hypothetical protein N8T08_005723 [Aspergillus melleus]|uniref:Uncharacterized protein n=1 Tax=Aspergillus melleus TaxID=138277 RepID=A0ACC3B1T9_9EURO|nr:hypothetical protein N8T08_005723 [Aspergillus melleus]